MNCVYDSKIGELMRCIRSQISGLISGVADKEMAAMELGLAHSLSRYKLKFSPDKIDTMIVQAVSLLDDLDKELNNYIMRCREWYGWHFPELGKIITDNLAFIRTVQVMGMRTNAATTDMSEVLPEEIEQQVKEAAEISMGTEISEQDITNLALVRTGYGDHGIPRPALRLLEEQNERHRAQLDCPRRGTGRSPLDRARRNPDEPGQAPRLHCTDPRCREGALSSSEDQTRHAQIRSHLPRPAGRSSRH